MACRHYSLTLNGSAQVLSSVLANQEATNKTGIKTLTLQAAGANTGIIYVGGTTVPNTAAVSSTNYGFRIEIPVSTIPSAPVFFEDLAPGELTLADLQVIGTNNDVLKITIIPHI